MSKKYNTVKRDSTEDRRSIMFPVEIWEEILKYGDAKDLVRFRRVSRTWNAIITQILERGHIWYRQCVQDIPRYLWNSILEQQIDFDIPCEDVDKARNNFEIWFPMHRSWRGWRRAITNDPSIGSFEPLPQHRPLEYITCVAALSNIIAIGSSEGYVTFYDISIDKIFYRADHAEHLEAVQLFRKGELMIAMSLSINGRIKFWNLMKNEEEKSLRCSGELINANFAKCYVMHNRYVTVYELSEIDKNTRSRMWISSIGDFNEYVMHGDNIMAVGADGNKVTLCASNIHVCINFELELFSAIQHTDVNEPEILIRYYKVFKAGVVACIGVYGEFGFSINSGNWKIYNLFRKFGSPVTTVLFHVALLVLGLQSGEVYLFPVRDVESLENLDFDKIESKRLLLDTKAIISLNVTEYDSVQYLVAASNKHVHLVKFT